MRDARRGGGRDRSGDGRGGLADDLGGLLAALLIGSGLASALGVLAGGDVRRAADTRMVPAC
jgi:hypothetical protein